MKEKIKKWLKPVLFIVGGALVGLAYYYLVGCSTGACPLTSNPFITMAYMGFIGWLLFGIFGKGCSGSCNTQWLTWRALSPSYRSPGFEYKKRPFPPKARIGSLIAKSDIFEINNLM